VEVLGKLEKGPLSFSTFQRKGRDYSQERGQSIFLKTPRASQLDCSASVANPPEQTRSLKRKEDFGPVGQIFFGPL